MIKKTSLGLLLLVLTSSCVSSKIYKDLEDRFADLKRENRKLSDELSDLSKTKNELDLSLDDSKSQLERLKSDHDKLQANYNSATNNLKALRDSYAALEKNSSEALQSNLNKNRELLAQLEAKEKALAVEQERLNKLKAELQSRSQRVDELEAMISAKEANMKRLKETLSKALNSFEGKGLTVEQKNGKVYVSMENKLLFDSGSWTVGTEGKTAVVTVAKVLADNPDISVLIEGHTDNDAYRGSGIINGNWDLSTKRAIAIVDIVMQNKKVHPQNLTAAGRSEYAPIATNDTPEGKSKNRRIEIILTPKLDEISKLLNDI